MKLSASEIVTRSPSTVTTSFVWPVGLASVKVGHSLVLLAIVNRPLLSSVLSRRSKRSLFILEDVENLSLASDRRSKVLFSVVLDSDGSRTAGWDKVDGLDSVGCCRSAERCCRKAEMSSAVNPSVDAFEFNSLRASAIVPLVCWIVGVGDTSPSSRSSKERRFSSF